MTAKEFQTDQVKGETKERDREKQKHVGGEQRWCARGEGKVKRIWRVLGEDPESCFVGIFQKDDEGFSPPAPTPPPPLSPVSCPVSGAADFPR